MPSRLPALRLTLGHAPAVWHSVDGLPGFYHPEIPTPVGGIGEPTVEAAKDAAQRPGCPVESCTVTATQAAELREQQESLRRRSRRALKAAGDAVPHPLKVATRGALTPSKE